MGAGSSKKAPSMSSPSSCSSHGCLASGKKRNKQEMNTRGRRNVFRSSCFGCSDSKMKNKENNGKSTHILHRVQINEEKPSSSTQIPEFQSPNSQLSSEEYRETRSHKIPIPGCSSNTSNSSTIISNNNNNTKSKNRFKFTQGNVSFRLNRALSLGSSTTHNLFSNNNNNPPNSLSHENTSQNQEHQEPISEIIQTNTIRNRTTIRTQEMENNVRFSRTLSVGRLRDRVLRRTPFSEGIFAPILSDESLGINSNVRRILRRAGSYSHNMSDPYANDNVSNNNNNNDLGDYGNENENNRELLERRSAFLERRRRIRSQVRALQRLGGSRRSSLTSAMTSCVMSGRHRTENCTCLMATNNRTVRTGTGTDEDDESGTRRSISRIVILAEALFEVLDEIHQQSVVLSSSRESFPTVGSVPAPKEMVESLPVKFYKKNPKNNEDICQCYICLVEYEEGDGMRVLPCKHEFHLTCVDKWLKEIHRVCPLCRGDVCRADAKMN